MNHLESWLPAIWLAAAFLFGIFEAATVQLVAIWFAVGSLAALVPAMLGGPFWLQFVTFTAASVLSLAMTRPLVAKVLRVRKTPTNADRIVGMIGVVTERIDNVEERGRVLVDGINWAARSEDGDGIEQSERVVVKKIEGAKVIVVRVL